MGPGSQGAGLEIQFMPPEEKLGKFTIDVVYREGHYVATIHMSFGTKTIIQRGLALRSDHEQSDLYTHATEELAWWIEAVATTVQADRQARADAG